MYTTISEAQEDFRIGYDTLPSLTESYNQFDKDDLVRKRTSRFNPVL